MSIIMYLFFLMIYTTYSLNFTNFILPENFEDIICSYRSTETIRNGNTIVCVCDEDYYTIQTQFKVNGVDAQCNYEKKRRYYYVFLAIVQPFGFEFYYIESYAIFWLNLMFSIGTICMNIYNYITWDEKFNFFNNKKYIICFSCLIILLALWILKIVLSIFVETDGNYVPFVEDLKTLFVI